MADGGKEASRWNGQIIREKNNIGKKKIDNRRIRLEGW